MFWLKIFFLLKEDLQVWFFSLLIFSPSSFCSFLSSMTSWSSLYNDWWQPSSTSKRSKRLRGTKGIGRRFWSKIYGRRVVVDSSQWFVVDAGQPKSSLAQGKQQSFLDLLWWLVDEIEPEDKVGAWSTILVDGLWLILVDIFVVDDGNLFLAIIYMCFRDCKPYKLAASKNVE